MVKKPNPFELRGRKKTLEDFQRDALRAYYTQFENWYVEQQKKVQSLEVYIKTNNIKNDQIIRGLYKPSVDALKVYIRNFVRLLHQVDGKLIARKSVTGELVVVTSDEMPFYTLRAKLINSIDSRWKPEYMTLYHNAVTGEGIQKGYTVKEAKLKYWFAPVSWADVLIEELLPRHKHEIIED